MESLDTEVLATTFVKESQDCEKLPEPKVDITPEYDNKSSSDEPILVKPTDVNLRIYLNWTQFSVSTAKSFLFAGLTLFLLNINLGEALAQIRRGNKGNQVQEIQRCLKRLGYFNGPVNGNFGPLTESAVTKFQRRVGLPQYGFVGPKTDAALKRRCRTSRSTTSTRINCNSLRYGCNGAAVRRLQRNLKTLGYYNTAVTGKFRELTQSAVIRFQRANGIDAIGVVGPQTKNAIERGLRNPRATPTPRRPQSTGVYCDPNVRSLSVGCNGFWVRKLQEDLRQIGYFNSPIDGNYGRLTQNAVMTFQQVNNLQMTGVADFQTLDQIRFAVNGANPPVQTDPLPPTITPRTIPPRIPPTGIPPTITPRTIPPAIPSVNPSTIPPVSVPGMSLNLGSRGPQVTALQQDLQQLGYFRAQPTGIFDRLTQEAIIRFQQDNRIPATGIGDRFTLEQIRRITSNRRGTGGGDDFEILYEGISSNRVRQVQLRLKELGFFRNAEATGYFGSITRNAVSAYQQFYDLPITGNVDEATWRKLGLRVENGSRRYAVIVPVTKAETIVEVRQYYPTAFVNRSRRGDYVNVGEFQNINDARKVSNYLRDRNLDARVEYL